ncbi:MAG: UvrD-helicase domain-containing protein [Candidatus Krumholzibacteriota bacterium]|nr:UvrD-helicase domain-containing protein [Candidatus Krumholzibacteriota bacterium]
MTGGNEQTLVDQAQRERAEEAVDESLCLEAGAGTGKTTLLVNRYLSILKKGRAKCTEIVAITFTDKAAAEMKTRLRREISELTRSAGDDSFELEESLVDLERAPISTIHSFASSILRDFPAEAGIDPDFSMLTDPDDSLFLEECWQDFLSSTSYPKDYFPKRFLNVGGGVDKLKELAFAFYHSRSERHVEGILGKEDEKETAKEKSSLKGRRNLTDIETFYQDLNKYADMLSSYIRNHCTNHKDNGFIEIEAFLGKFEVARHLEGESLEDFLLLLDLPKAKGAKKNFDPPEICTEQKKAVKEMAALQREYRKIFMDRTAEGLTGWFVEFIEYVKERKKAEGVLDFDDLLIETRKLLDNDEVLDLLKGRYRYILVDEFQDTDSLQAEIVFLLGGMNRDGKFCRRHGPSSLFIVGDPKQSIYRFRKADIEVYENVKRHFIEEGSYLKITQNFRSGRDIIEWINASFSALIRKPERGGYQPAYEAIEAHRRDAGTEVILLDLEYGDKKMNADGLRALEGDGVARFIKEIISEERIVRDVNTKEFRPVKYSDIALIYRGSTGLENYEEPLRLEGIPYIVEGGGLFYKRQEIRDLSMAMWAIEDPFDSIALVSILRSSLFGFSDEEIYLFRENGGELNYLSGGAAEDSGFKDIGEAFKVLSDLHEGRNEIGASATMKDLLRRTNYREVSLFRPHGYQRVANIKKAVRRARDFDNSLRSFRSFAGWFKDQWLSETREGESSLVDEDENAVRLTSVHKSKGLQFPVVIMINLLQEIKHRNKILIDRGRKIDFSLRDNWNTSEFEKSFERDVLKENAENLRLLYVASTRSGDLLVIPEVPKKKSYFQLLKNNLPTGSDYEADDPDIGESAGDDQKGENRFKEAKELVTRLSVSTLPLLSDVVKPFARIDKTDKRSRSKSRGEKEEWIEGRKRLIDNAASVPLTITPSSLKDVERMIRHSPPESESRIYSKEGSGNAADFGLAFHRLMEIADFNAPEDIEKLAEAVSVEFGLPGKKDDLASLASKALSSNLIEAALNSERILREVPFSVPVRGKSAKDDLREMFINGRVDLLFYSAGVWTAVDYKTDNIRDPEKRFKNYRGQGALYALALGRIGIELRGGVIFYFVRPDKEIKLEIEDISEDDLLSFGVSINKSV